MGEANSPPDRVGPGDPVDRLAALQGTNLLVVAPPMSGKRSFGRSVLAAGVGSGRDALFVTTSRSVASLPFDPAEAGRFGVVDCTPNSVGENAPVVNVGSPGDLTGISMPVSRFLDGAEDPVVLLDSISSILQYADEESAFRFLSVLTSRLAAASGVGLYTFDEGIHSEQTYRTFAQLFDSRVELRGIGDAGTDPGGDTGGAGTTEVRLSGVPGAPDGWTSVRTE
jgi:KaiC/GvpD/RAD55 family RecA-like ATPase